MSTSWIYLVAASIAEICWIYSLKFLDFKKLIRNNVLNLIGTREGFLLLLPALLYVLFGLTNIYFFSRAMEKLSASIAFAVWMAIALIGVKLIDVLILKETVSAMNLFFLALLLIGIVGLKYT
jgi:quaternary ammonium compound-resistance protein SugE